MRLGFYGTPELAVPYLQALAARHEIVGVVTQPDRPKGRSGRPQASPVKRCALELGLRVLQPEPGQCPVACREIEQLGAELCAIVAFGQKLPCGGCGCAEGKAVNVHYSLLPLLRGAAPVQHAILQGLETTGVTVQYVAPGWDEGDILVQRELTVMPDDTCGTLTARLTEIGVPALLEAVGAIERGTAMPRAQDHERATFAPLIRKSDGELDWCESATMIARKVRAFDPWPGARTTLRSRQLGILAVEVETGLDRGIYPCGTIVAVDPCRGFAVSCGEGGVWLERVRPEGKRPMSAPEFMRGARLEVGERLG